jgi:hypothetical protein
MIFPQTYLFWYKTKGIFELNAILIYTRISLLLTFLRALKFNLF